MIENTPSGEWSVKTPGARITSDRVLQDDGSWVPLDPNVICSVLSNSFIVKNAGDGYFWFKGYGQGVKNTYSTFYSIIAEAASNNETLNPAPPDGRAVIVESR